MSEQVKLYTSNNCPACEAAKRWLKENGIEFVEINLNHNEDEAFRLAQMGLLSVPVIEVNGNFIAGFSQSLWRTGIS